ncbi:MAG TPA: BlaI/MecI/CopY family transcriptional regulator [Chitinophagaceae bacterium]|nr:BlaI/MecI/CopY family transcriptional regulator [Chitinophagaceae bacterium]HMZ45506.1 BlaI/MecI/CopY family transcriptional regulator [Chitinophagaceae bacterium]HNE93171.1 BlaI/MecI/CopY family transcriptional regulator [Chitinophagaceae bacterium]HNF29579.1 BlaI/MecI/CopY family transcriptional regulator [Chitinophagaceae bacterium]HNJ57658.1 BlaI/MecI/CopY family transcriptional regulator [Chitinophagaceae bacterium]
MFNKQKIKPTESELEILRILWDKKSASVREVHEILSLHKESGYTTTLKLLQIMFEKSLVIRDDTSKVHIYTPNVSKESTQKQFMHKMVETLFGGSSVQLAMQALGNSKPSKDELEEIEKILNRLKNK